MSEPNWKRWEREAKRRRELKYLGELRDYLRARFKIFADHDLASKGLDRRSYLTGYRRAIVDVYENFGWNWLHETDGAPKVPNDNSSPSRAPDSIAAQRMRG